MTSLRAVIFDLDFTLADSSSGIVECASYALGELGFSAPSRQRVIETIGLSLAETFERLTGVSNSQLTTQFSQLFHQHADRVMEANTVIYDSVKPVICRLRKANFGTAIVSTKLHYRINNILEVNGLRQQFDVIVGSDDVIRHKPDPEGILLALRVLKVTPGSAVYVGDHVVDAQAAYNAGVAFIATLSGMHASESFEQYPCQAIVEDLRAVPAALGLS